MPLNSTSLCSSSRNDYVGALRDILISSWKIVFDSLSKAQDGVPIPTLPVFEVNGASTRRLDEELLQELSESIRLSVDHDRNMPINQEKNPSEAAPIILNEEVPLGVYLSPLENLQTFEDQSTQGTPVPSNQGQVILPVSYLECLVSGTLLHPAETFASCFNSSQQAAVNFIAQPPRNLDPFEIELGRLHKEQDLIEASYEKLKSGCEKEMEEVVAQIQSIYNAKLQDIEVELQLRMKEIYANYYKVLMNKRLACSFKSICIDLKLDSSISSSAPNLQLDGEIRSLAPHLQPFRPRPATISSPSFPRHTPSLGAAINRPLSSSPSCPQLQPQLPLPSNLPITWSGAPEFNGLMNLPAPNSSLSALGLFMDVNRGADVILPNSANASSTLSANTTNNTGYFTR